MKRFYMNLPQNMEDFEQQMELFKAKGFVVVNDDKLGVCAKRGRTTIILV